MIKLKSTPFAMVVFKDIDRLEHDAKSQYRFNRFWALSWFAMLVAVPFFPSLYGHTMSALLIQEISLWANFATHFGAMSSALAAASTHEVITDISADVDDINEDTDALRSVVGVTEP